MGNSLDINCGFRPSYITICAIVGTNRSNSIAGIYDKRISDTSVTVMTGISAVGSENISSSANQIKSINDNGFTVGYYFTSRDLNKTVYWLAVE